MPCGKARQFRVDRVAFVGYMRREGTGLVGQQPLLAHACHVLNELMGI